MAVHLRAASSFRGTDFRSAMTQQPRVGSRALRVRGRAAAGRRWGPREVTQGIRGGSRHPTGERWCGSEKVIRFGFSKDA